jgi:uncharacterized membrane protein YfcA
VAGRGHFLDFGVGVVFCLISARMIAVARSDTVASPATRHEGENAVRGRLSHKLAIGAVAGALPGLLGIGTGGILVPAFTFLLGAPIKTAMAASLTAYSFTAATSSAFKLAQGYVVLEVAVPLCLGTLVGANLGARMNRRFHSRGLHAAFGILFAFVSLKFIVSALAAVS